ncbi:MAG: Gfo/Idh/MocA family oxidoreductase [Clostridiales bacterium]|nr:Gfo/Idh/MocA family oxidoreductase [Clostridiales bacterium]
MQNKNDGSTYAPKGKRIAVCGAHEFEVGVIGLDHGHIFGMCNGLTEAGADITFVFDPDPEKVGRFLQIFPNARPASSMEEVLNSSVKMIVSAAVPSERAAIGIAAMQSDKDYFADKPSFTTFEQIKEVRGIAAETKRRYFTYFSERLHVEASVYAEQLLENGVIGKVVQVMGWGPHRLNEPSRPSWFFDERRYGGILVDIGCHQIEQMMFYAKASDAQITKSRIGNYNHPEHPNFQDFGDVMLTCDNGVTGYFRVDWFTPDGLNAWGDGRTIIVGTDGYIEIRKYLDIANSMEGDHVYWVDRTGEHHECVSGKCGFPFFGRMILDCLNRSENAMRQEYIFRVMELAVEAQNKALKIK